MKNTLLTLWLSTLILAISCQKALAETAFKIIELQYRMADEILPVVQTLVGSNGVVTSFNNQLIIRADSARMAEIEQTIATLDTARRNLKITVSHDAVNQYQQDNTSAQGNVKIGKIIIGNSHQLPPNNARINVQRSTSNISQFGSQFINVLDGERAFIRTGQIVPYTQAWLVLTRRYIRLQQTTEFKEVATGFAVRARSVGGENSDEFEVEITPRIARLNNGLRSSNMIDFEALSTTVRVHKGEWLDIGQTMLNHDDVSRQILSTQNQSSMQSSNLSVRID